MTNPTPPSLGHALRAHFSFPTGHRNFNTGSWGCVPTRVSAYRRALLDEAESRPDNFQRRALTPALNRARGAVAAWLGARSEDTVFVTNATTGANVVLRNIEWREGDRVLVFSFGYDAFVNALTHIQEMSLMRVEAMPIAFGGDKVPSHADIVALFVETVAAVRRRGETPRLVLFDTFPATPAIRLPYAALVEKARELGVLSLVDGAHGLGFEPFNLTELDADFFVSNAHKWAFVPLSCAVLVVPERNQHLIRTTLPTGYAFVPKDASEEVHGRGGDAGESQFVREFRYVATVDWTPALCIEEAFAFRKEVCGGEIAIHDYIADLAARGGQLVARELGTRVLDNPAGELARDVPMTLVLLPIDLAAVGLDERGPMCIKAWIEDRTMAEFDTFFKIDVYDGGVWVRLSAQIFLELSDFEWAAGVLKMLCERVMQGEHLADIVKP